jgi:hypothetical protein
LVRIKQGPGLAGLAFEFGKAWFKTIGKSLMKRRSFFKHLSLAVPLASAGKTLYGWQGAEPFQKPGLNRDRNLPEVGFPFGRPPTLAIL